MQNRYAGDIGDYIKFALLRAISHGLSLGVAWYLYPDESHNADGRHIGYLSDAARWRHLDPELFDSLASTVVTERTVSALEASGTLASATFASEPLLMTELPANQRSTARAEWFARSREALGQCEIVFADPDNGLVDNDPHRRRSRKFGKQMPLEEALSLAEGRQAVFYHHNTRFKGGHDLEVRWWQSQLGSGTIAVRANAYSCRTFFIVNPSATTRARVEAFCERWSGHQVRMVAEAAMSGTVPANGGSDDHDADRGGTWLSTDEAEDVAGSARQAIRCLEMTSEDGQAWKWAALALHSLLQGACVCHLVTTAPPIGVISAKDAAKWIGFFEQSRTQRGLAPPRTFILPLPDLLAAIRKPNSAGDRSNVQGIYVSDDEIAWLKRFNEQIRNEFVHFSPKGWCLEVSGIPELGKLIARIVEEIRRCGWAFRYKDQEWQSALKANLHVLSIWG